MQRVTTNGTSIINEYDLSGRLIKTLYADGSFIINEYDAAGNLVKKADEKDNVTVDSYDANGNLTSRKITDASGNILFSNQSKYDNKNQLIETIDANGKSTLITYDASGNEIRRLDAKGNVTQNEYDAQNRLIKVTDALGGITEYEYDLKGNRTKVIAPNGAVTTFEYDNSNLLTKETSADRGTTTYSYDSLGNNTQIIDTKGNIKNISFDLLSRKTGESWVGSPDLTVTYVYDSCNNGVGKLCSVVDKSGNTSYQYDIQGRVVQKIQTITSTNGSVNLVKQYAYNISGLLVREILPSGTEISYGYDAGNVDSISIDGHSYISNITYNAVGQLTGWIWSDGTTYSRTYDVNGRLNTYMLAGVKRRLSYDSLGNIIHWTDTGSDETQSFVYDSLNRLTDYTRINLSDILQSQFYSYDANGNRIELENDGVQTLYNILNDSNRLTQLDVINYQYDVNGSVVDDGVHIHHYDARNRLAGVDASINYFYNADNQRVRKSTSAGTTLYGWDNDRIYAEYDEGGQVIQETIYFDSMPVALLKGSNVYRIYSDQIDTPRVLADASNTVVWAWDSKPFGESLPDEDVDKDGSLLTYNLRFPGQYFDAETSKHYNYNRDYDPVTGRYIQSDPIGLDGGLNTYSYVSNNPLTLKDAKGLSQYDGTGCWYLPIFLGPESSWVEAFSKTTEHTARNSLNWCPNIEPKSGIDDWGYSWGPDSGLAADCYHGGWKGWRTYRSNDDGSQCTYDTSGNLQIEGIFRGTFDYEPAGSYAHFQKDVQAHHRNPNYQSPDLTIRY